MVRYDEIDEFGNDSTIIITEETAILRYKVTHILHFPPHGQCTDKQALDEFLLIHGAWVEDDI